MRELTARPLAGPPPLTEAEEVVAATVDATGRPAVLATERPDLAVAREYAPSGVSWPATKPAEECPAAVYVHDGRVPADGDDGGRDGGGDGGDGRGRDGGRDGADDRGRDGGWRRIELAFLPVSNVLIDMLPGDEILVVGVRCRAYEGFVEDNAHVFGPDGRRRARFCMGDGISQLAADRDGEIWAGYFDEGVFGNNGWGSRGGPDPLGRAGLVRWSARGERLWTYDPPDGIDSIADCYRLNVGDGVAWTYYYDFFHLVEIRDGRVGRAWPMPRRGIRAVAATDRSVLIVRRDEVVGFELADLTAVAEDLRRISSAASREHYEQARQDLITNNPGEPYALRISGGVSDGEPTPGGTSGGGISSGVSGGREVSGVEFWSRGPRIHLRTEDGSFYSVDAP